MNIGENIKKIRKEKEIKQKELAAMLELPISTLANYENGHRQPNLDTIKKIADTLEISAIDIIEENSNIAEILKSSNMDVDDLFEFHVVETFELEKMNNDALKAAKLFKEILDLVFVKDSYPFTDTELVEMLHSPDFENCLHLLHFKYTNLPLDESQRTKLIYKRSL